MRKLGLLMLLALVLGGRPAETISRGSGLDWRQDSRLINTADYRVITPDEAKQLAKADLLIIDYQAQQHSADSLRLIKQYNPQVKIAAYLPVLEINNDSLPAPGASGDFFYQQISPDWQLKNDRAELVYRWPENPVINVSTLAPAAGGARYYDVFPWLVKNQIMDSGLWDGIFLARAWDDIEMLLDFNLDLNQDGVREDPAVIKQSWQQGLNYIFSNTRNVLGADAVILSARAAVAQKYLKRELFTGATVKYWPPALGDDHEIAAVFEKQEQIIRSAATNQTALDNTASARGYVNGAANRAFDQWGNVQHSLYFTYDPAFPGLAQIIKQDFDHDGCLDVLVVEDAKIRIDDCHGQTAAVFYPYGLNHRGPVNAAAGDLNNDGTVEIVTGAGAGNGPQIRVFDYHGRLINPGFFAFDEKSRGGVSVALGDVDADGFLEIVAGSGHGQIKIFNAAGQPEAPAFSPYGRDYNSGTAAAAADLNQDGRDEIITVSQGAGWPLIRIWDMNGTRLFSQYYVDDLAAANDVSLLIGDVDNDQWPEIIAARRSIY